MAKSPQARTPEAADSAAAPAASGQVTLGDPAAPAAPEAVAQPGDVHAISTPGSDVTVVQELPPAAPEPPAPPVPVETPARADILGALPRMVDEFDQIRDALNAHATAAIRRGEHDTEAALSGLATAFHEFRNGVLGFGRSLPGDLASEAAELVAKAKLLV
jgi:hypothetical protein